MPGWREAAFALAVAGGIVSSAGAVQSAADLEDMIKTPSPVAVADRNTSAKPVKSTETAALSPLERELKSAGIRYSKNAQGNFNVTWTVDGVTTNGEKRSQLVVVGARTETFADLEVRHLWSVAYRGPRLPRNALADYLIDSGTRKIGSWEIVVNDETKMESLLFTMKVPANVTGEQLRTLTSSAAETADGAELKLDGGDEF